MIRVNLFGFYELGSALGKLEDVTEGASAHEFFLQSFYARVHLETALESKIIPLGTSRKAGEKLFAAVDALWTSLLKPGDRTDLITGSEAYAIATSKKEFETVLAAEMPGLATFFVQKKAIFDTADLIERADCIFSAEVLARMPSEAHKDIREAGRCLAFELYTATGFHIFRAMESVIVALHKSLPKAPPLKNSDRNWAKYIEGLEKGGADPKITGYLTYFRKAHRNPVTHPETVLTKDEAIAIFHALPNAIVLMINALPPIPPTPPAHLPPPPS
ncbi:MAG: hypothetical protein QOF63_2179 [Thermoanaerobaculia bacterium]|nr:hypothetical protein [Thermoanaerobaculia bacterium]